MRKLFLIEKVTTNRETFEKSVIALADELGINPDWIMAVMYFESRLNPKAVNKYSNATGLIQFMPATAKELGTTVYDLARMDNVQQMRYVRAYFLKFKNKLKTLGDTYLAVFYPALIGKPGSTVLPKNVQEQNPVFKPYWTNGLLTKDSIVKYFINFFNNTTPTLLPPILILLTLIYIIL